MTFFRSNGSQVVWNVQGESSLIVSASAASSCYMACKAKNVEGARPGQLVGLVSIRGSYDNQKICQPTGWNTRGIIHDQRLDNLCAEHFSHDPSTQDQFSAEGDTFYWLLNIHEVIAITD